MCWCYCCCCCIVTRYCLLCPWSTLCLEKVVVTWPCSFLKAFHTPPRIPWGPNILLRTLFADVLWMRDLMHNNTWICVCNFIFALVDKHKDKSFCTEQEQAFSEYKKLCKSRDVCPSHMTCELSEKGPIRARKSAVTIFFLCQFLWN